MDIILMYIVLSINNMETTKINDKIIFDSVHSCSEYVFNNSDEIKITITKHMAGKHFLMNEIGCIDITTQERTPLKNQS